MSSAVAFRRWVLPGLVLATVLSAPVLAQTYYDETYVFGGQGQSVGKNLGGIYLSTPTGTTRLTSLVRHSRGFTTDLDNRSVVFGVESRSGAGALTGPYAGLYRVDPGTLWVTTLAGPDTLRFGAPYKIEIDQDGNYLFACSTAIPSGSSYTFQDALFRLDRSGRLTTVLAPGQSLPTSGRIWHLCKNVDTGRWLMATPGLIGTLKGPILEVDDSGAVSTWYGGGTHGFASDIWDSFEQDVTDGAVIGLRSFQTATYLLRLQRGEKEPTTLGVSVPQSTGVQMLWGSALDLQTAPRLRWILYGYDFKPPVSTYVIVMDHQTCVYIRKPMIFSANSFAGMLGGLEIHGRRNIQTVRTGAHRWSILLSCPRSPGYRYVLAAGLSGVRPAVLLPDGRRIHLRPDPLVFATIRGPIPGLWDPGAGVLNGRGEARGEIDLSGLGRSPGGFGHPLWLAMVVLDPAAPTGVRFVPETYVMRI